MDIKILRQEINAIDSEILTLFKKRMQVAAQVAEYKREKGLPILDAARERELLCRVVEEAGEEYADYAQALFQTLMAVSRSYQGEQLAKTAAEPDALAAIRAATPDLFPKRATVACQGVEGAFSQIAATKLFALPSIVFCRSFEHVFRAVEDGLCRYGVLPLENSTAGSVNAIYDLMIKYRFHIVRSVKVKVDHNLLAKRGTKLADIREIFSHEQAIRQCSEFLDSLPGVKVTVCENTAAAARMVAESKRDDIAALSSRSCAEQYGLSLIAPSVQNTDNNFTRFICLSKTPEIYPGSHRTSLMMTLSHKPGTLYRVLAKFYALGVNLVKLESRPIPDRDFEFMFYFDIDMPAESPAFARLLAELAQESEDFRYLGSYIEI